MEWSREQTLQFIEFYKSFPILWNSNHEFYKDRAMRHTALLHIATKFEIDKSEVERKIKNLQSHFLRELKKEQESRRKPWGKTFKSKWFAYKPLSFLTCRGKKIQKTVDSQMSTRPKTRLTQGCSSATQDPLNPPSPQNFQDGDDEDANPAKKKRYNDEYQIFGDYVASELRNMHYLKNVGELKRKIQHLIIQYTEIDDSMYLASRQSQELVVFEEPSTSKVDAGDIDDEEERKPFDPESILSE